MQIGAQYYRPPFPEERHWETDLKNIRAAGFNILQLWVLWGWIEARPGTYDFSDYDRLIERANKNGLKVVLSAIAEVQPHWIHREIPGSEMLNHLGQKVVSTNRNECHFGISPGGCFDHPAVWKRMQEFFRAVVGRYKDAPNLYGWDAWNELRWNVHAQGLVCFCEHSLKYFHAWLDNRYGGLDGLNQAWQRRYISWDDVAPGWAPNRPFTETVAFQHFLTARANEHGRKRYEIIKSLDTAHPITMHGGAPSPYYCGGEWCGQIITPLDRGNDWDMAPYLDGIGCSSFPKHGGQTWVDFAARMEIIRSAAGKKKLWLSELQGGRAGQGFEQQAPVQAIEQQHWLWNAMAVGAEAVLFWCWKDEVFTTEAGGFGITGLDGYAMERLAAFKSTAGILEKHGNILDKYRPAEPETGIFFSPQSEYLHWCHNKKSERYLHALLGYGKALIRKNIPFEMIEEEHLEGLKRLKILLMPRSLAVDDRTAAKLLDYVSEGGALAVESECGAFDSRGIYRYPADRFLNRVGICETGRRTVDGEIFKFKATLGKRRFELAGTQWVTPYRMTGGQKWAGYGEDILAGEVAVGKGRIILLGTYLGETYFRKCSAGLEDFLKKLCEDSDCSPRASVIGNRRDNFYIRAGISGNKRVFFVFCMGSEKTAVIKIHGNHPAPIVLRDLISDKTVKGVMNQRTSEVAFKFHIPKERLLVLMEGG